MAASGVIGVSNNNGILEMELGVYLFICQAKLFFRDKVAVLLTVFLPLIMGVTMTYSLLPAAQMEAIGTESSAHSGVDNDDRSHRQPLLIEFLAASSNDDLVSFVDQVSSNAEFRRVARMTYSQDTEASLSRFDRGEVNILLFVEEQGDSGIIEMKLAAANPYVNSIGELLVRELVSQLNLMVAGTSGKYRVSRADSTETASAAGAPEGGSPRQSEPTATTSQVAFYLPNFLALSMLWLGLFSSALPLASDRAEGVFVQLSTANLRMETLIASYVLWRIAIGVVLSVLFVASGMILLGIEGVHNIPVFVASIVLGNLFMTVFGVLLVSLSSSVQTANVATQISNLVLMFTSGLMLPLDTVPDALRYVAYVNPLTYIGDLLRQAMMNYQPMNDVTHNLTILTFILVVMVVVIKFKWRWR